jgi:AcrR family transcriptional regulator
VVAADPRVADRRSQFLAAGFELFGTRGVADVRVKELCAAAGLTDRYFYESFKNIEELFDVVLTDLATQGNQVFETAMRDALAAHPTDIRAWLRAGISSTFRFLSADPRRVRIALVETIAMKGHGDGRRVLNAIGENDLLRWIPRISDAGSFRPHEAPLRAIALVGAGTELMIAWAEGRLATDPETIAEFITDLCLSGTSILSPDGTSLSPDGTSTSSAELLAAEGAEAGVTARSG